MILYATLLPWFNNTSFVQPSKYVCASLHAYNAFLPISLRLGFNFSPLRILMDNNSLLGFPTYTFPLVAFNIPLAF
jgi:hypothetical protein